MYGIPELTSPRSRSSDSPVSKPENTQNRTITIVVLVALSLISFKAKKPLFGVTFLALTIPVYQYGKKTVKKDNDRSKASSSEPKTNWLSPVIATATAFVTGWLFGSSSPATRDARELDASTSGRSSPPYSAHAAAHGTGLDTRWVRSSSSYGASKPGATGRDHLASRDVHSTYGAGNQWTSSPPPPYRASGPGATGRDGSAPPSSFGRYGDSSGPTSYDPWASPAAASDGTGGLTPHPRGSRKPTDDSSSSWL